MARHQLVEQVVPHLYADKVGGITGSETDLSSQGSIAGKIKSPNL